MGKIETEILQNTYNGFGSESDKSILSSRIISALTRDFGCVDYVIINKSSEDDLIFPFRTSELMKRLIPEWEAETGFSNKLNLLCDRLVHEQDRKRFREESSRERILERLSNDDMYYVNHRVVIDGTTRFYQLMFSAIREGREPVGIVAGLHSIDKQVRKESESQKQIQLMRNVIKDETVVIVDCARNTKKTIHNASVCAGRFSDEEKYTESFMKYVEDYVNDHDKERMRAYASTDYLLECLGTEGEHAVRYRDNTTGVQRFYEMKIIRYSETEIVQTFNNVDALVVNTMLFENMKDDYFAIFIADLETGLIRSYKEDPLNILGEEGNVSTLSEAMLSIASRIDGAAGKFFENHSDIEYIKAKYATEDRREFVFKSALEEKNWTKVTGAVFSRDNEGRPLLFCLAFNYLGQEAAEAEEMHYLLEIEAKRNDLILETFNAGKWIYEIDENDEVISASYSDDIVNGVNTIEIADNPMGWLEVVHPEERENISEKFYAAILDHSGNTKFDVVFRAVTTSGRYRWTKSAGRVIRRPDGSGEFIGLGFDITNEVEKHEEEERRLNEALKEARTANKAKTDFLFNMSHDIRTPMNAIVGFSALAKKHIDDREKVLEDVKKISEAGELLLSLFNDILDMSYRGTDKIQISEDKGDIYQSFSHIELSLLELSAAREIFLSFSYGDIRDRKVYADFGRCNRVFINLVTNAINFTNKGGYVRVKCEQTGTRDGYGIYRYTFEDNGIGMSEEFTERMYEEFAREETSTVSGVRGAGLGLTLCKTFIDTMNGTIECHSRRGEGTTFVVTLPLKLQEGSSDKNSCDENICKDILTENNTGESAQNSQNDFAGCVGKHILLVEDNEMNMEIAQEILTEKGLVVECANDGTVAVRMMREKGPNYYDFILMDIQMPIMNGYEATREIRAMYPDAQIPIIAVSANAFEEDKIESRAAGMSDHIAKPIKVDKLFAVLNRYN